MASRGKRLDGLVAARVEELCVDPLTSVPLLILRLDAAVGERQGPRLGIWIGASEASAIAASLAHVALERPSTHDLLCHVLEQCTIGLRRVEIRERIEETYRAQLVLGQSRRTVLVDARPSDAVALALRAGAPIYVARHLTEEIRGLLPEEGGDAAERGRRARELLESMPDEEFGKWKM